MAKSSKKSKETEVPERKPAAPDTEAQSGRGAAQPVKPAAAKSAASQPAERAKSAGKSRGASTRKTSAGRKPRAPKGQKTPGAGEIVISDDDIRIRAYFISERRMQNGVPGDSALDWLEARRQLQEEASMRA